MHGYKKENYNQKKNRIHRLIIKKENYKSTTTKKNKIHRLR